MDAGAANTLFATAMPTTIKLCRNVNFLYEGSLACRELQSFGCEGVANDPLDWTRIHATTNGNADRILKRSAYSGVIDGQESVYAQLIQPAYQGGRFNRTRSVNQYLTHWIYPYQGKFHPQMIRALLNILGVKPGDTVGDFFAGSGTTALEATLLGASFVGTDLSPLCVLLNKVKTQSAQVVGLVRERVEALLARDDLCLDHLIANAGEDERVADFLNVARMVTFSDVARRRRKEPVVLRKNLSSMLQSITAHAAALEKFAIKPGTVSVQLGSACDLVASGIADESIDCIVTSPPYSIALDYVENDLHALAALGIDTADLANRMTGVRGRTAKEKLALYNHDLKTAFCETARVLKPGAKAAFILGDATVDKKEYTTTKTMRDWAAAAGLRHEITLKKIVFGLYSVMKDEDIMILAKP